MKEACPKPTSMPTLSFKKSIFAEGFPFSSKTEGWLSHPFLTNSSSNTSLNEDEKERRYQCWSLSIHFLFLVLKQACYSGPVQQIDRRNFSVVKSSSPPINEIINQLIKLLALQPSQPLLGILHLSNNRVSVFPEVEEFLIMFYGFRRLFQAHFFQQSLESWVRANALKTWLYCDIFQFTIAFFICF